MGEGALTYSYNDLVSEETVAFGSTVNGFLIHNRGLKPILLSLKEPGGSYGSVKKVISPNSEPAFFPIETDEIKVSSEDSKVDIIATFADIGGGGGGGSLETTPFAYIYLFDWSATNGLVVTDQTFLELKESFLLDRDKLPLEANTKIYFDLHYNHNTTGQDSRYRLEFIDDTTEVVSGSVESDIPNSENKAWDKNDITSNVYSLNSGLYRVKLLVKMNGGGVGIRVYNANFRIQTN
jgi:hypothetical protein